MFPSKVRWILYLNPMSSIVDAYRSIFYYKVMPNLTSLALVGILSFIILIIGYIIFRKLEKGFAEEV